MDKINEGERCLGYNYKNVFNKVLSKHNKYCCFFLLSTIIYAIKLPGKINIKIYNQSRVCNICPVSANIQKFDSSKFMSINFRGDIVYPVGEYKSRRRVYDKKRISV